jgi:DedD protein
MSTSSEATPPALGEVWLGGHRGRAYRESGMSEDTEFTLGTGKLLAFFFGMVVICGIFFSLGYGVGRNTSSAASTTVLDSSSLSTVQSSGAAKPSASKAISQTELAALQTDAQLNEQKPCVPGDANCASSTGATNERAAEASRADPTTPDPASKAAASNRTPELTNVSQPASGFMVQVAAVSKQEDADALVNALRKKQYPVFVVNQASSNLFHVQVGPFSQQKDAEAMRSKLVSDGYNAILKH